MLFIRTELLFDKRRPLPEIVKMRIFRSFEASDLHFILVSGIYDPDIRIADQGISFLRVYIFSDRLIGIDRGVAQGDNFRSGNDSETIEG